jgi:hypothetical protein
VGNRGREIIREIGAGMGSKTIAPITKTTTTATNVPATGVMIAGRAEVPVHQILKAASQNKIRL